MARSKRQKYLGLLSLLAAAFVVSGQGQTVEKTTTCHALLVDFQKVRFADIPTCTALTAKGVCINEWTQQQMQEGIALMEKAHTWQTQIDKCVTESPEQFSTKDWQVVAKAEAQLQKIFDDESAAIDAQSAKSVAEINYQMFNEKYSGLVERYNTLVDRCSAISSPPKRLFCTTSNLGHGDSTIYCSER